MAPSSASPLALVYGSPYGIAYGVMYGNPYFIHFVRCPPHGDGCPPTVPLTAYKSGALVNSASLDAQRLGHGMFTLFWLIHVAPEHIAILTTESRMAFQKLPRKALV